MSPKPLAYSKKIKLDPRQTNFTEIGKNYYLHNYFVDPDHFSDIEIREDDRTMTTSTLTIINHNETAYLTVVLFIRRREVQ